MNYNQKLLKIGLNMAKLSKRMNITPSLFEWRYGKKLVNFMFLKELVRALDSLIFELVQVREAALKEAWDIANTKKADIKELEGL